MLIVYHLETGEVLDNTGTNSLMPFGPPEDQAYINTDAMGVDRARLGLLRLHDVDDAALVRDILTNLHHVDVTTGEVVIDGPYPLRALTTDRDAIPADGATWAVVTYRDTHDDAPTEVVFDVNGAQTTVAMEDDQAQIAVTSVTPGPVVVAVGELVVTLTATEVT